MRRLLPLVIACALLGALAAQAAQATLLDDAYANFPASAADRTKFSFIALGDSRHWTPITQPEIFRQMIREANLLRPEFLVDVGDLILGYSGDPDMMNRMWDEFESVVRTSQAPFIPVVGNHDVSVEMHEQIYRDRIGELWFSFDFGNSHLICLDTDQVGYISRISPEQSAWLQADLEATNAEHIFVFLHKPLWKNPGVWEPIHALLAAHGADAVIAGHDHHFELHPERDGIKYVISGGGGAEIGRPPERGGFHHFLWITVEGPNVQYAVVKPGAILPLDIISHPEQATVARLESQFDPREIDLLAHAFAEVFDSTEAPVVAAADLARKSEGNLRAVALALIAHLADTRWVPYLPALANDPDPAIASAAYDALLASQHPTGLQMARDLLASSDPELARRAAISLALKEPDLPLLLRQRVPDLLQAADLAEEVAHWMLGREDLDQAIAFCNRVMQVFPEDDLLGTTGWVLWREAGALRNAGRLEQALTVVNEILERAPSPDIGEDLVPESLLRKAEILAQLGREEEALAVCQRLQAEFPKFQAAAQAAELADRLRQ